MNEKPDIETLMFLVMATGIKSGQPPVPLRVFQNRELAETWQAKLIDYHVSPPDVPGDDDPGTWKDYDTQLEAWRSAHPAGMEVSQYQHFRVYEVPLEAVSLRPSTAPT